MMNRTNPRIVFLSRIENVRIVYPYRDKQWLIVTKKKKKKKKEELDELREVLRKDEFSCLFNSREVLLMKLVPFNHRKDKDYERTTVTWEPVV